MCFGLPSRRLMCSAAGTRKGASGWTYDYLQGIALHDANFKTSEDRGHVHNCPREMPWPVVLVK
eukprot:312584-Rhodomonas_salina.1